MPSEALSELAERLDLPVEAWGVRLAISIGVVVGLVLLRWAAVRLVERKVDDPGLRYRFRKATSYIAVLVGLLSLGRVWISGVDTLLAILGLMAAGMVIAMQDTVRNIAGGVYIAVKHPLRVGDRVEIDGVAGDVVNIGLLGFNLLEIRGWVDADQTTGRVVHLPNGLLLTRPLANYGAGFNWIWHEVVVPLTFDSDVDRARMVLGEIIDAHAPDISEDGTERPREMLISFTRLQPAVYVHADERGVRLTARMRCELRQRRRLDNAVWTELLRRLRHEPDIRLTYAATRTEVAGHVEVREEGTNGLTPPSGPDSAARDQGAQ